MLEVHCPAEFSSKPNETHLKYLTKVFRITRKSFLIIYLWVTLMNYVCAYVHVGKSGTVLLTQHCAFTFSGFLEANVDI